MANVGQLLMQANSSYANTYEDAGIDVTVSLQSKGERERAAQTPHAPDIQLVILALGYLPLCKHALPKYIAQHR